MNIVSYRGPGMAGGVSAALSTLWAVEHAQGSRWYHMNDTAIKAFSNENQAPQAIGAIPQMVIDGHYRFCNEFLWPVMHDMPEYARYTAADHGLYRSFNTIFSVHLSAAARWWSRQYFVQDYQLALLPELLASGVKNVESFVFWHIPWPRSVEKEHLGPIAEMARALLKASAVGFHTQEYAASFLRFVEQNLADVSVDWTNFLAGGTTLVVVAPLGIDLDYWTKAAGRELDIFEDERFRSLKGKPFVLSVDRADYTKAVAERLEMIDRFFEHNPSWVGQMTFAQVCGRTRPGLAAFDDYWIRCRDLADRLKQRWASDNWQPLLWIETPVCQDDLALLYRETPVMLVNPVRDGLNLTAKEFVACQGERRGVLLLSAGAGAWHELGYYTIPVDPQRTKRMADRVCAALTMRPSEKLARVDLMREKLKANTLHHWWCYFNEALPERIAITRAGKWAAAHQQSSLRRAYTRS